MLRHRPCPISWAVPSAVFRAPEDSSAMSTARDGARGGFCLCCAELRPSTCNPQNQAEGIPSAPESPQEGVTQPSGCNAPGWVFLLNLEKLRAILCFVCVLRQTAWTASGVSGIRSGRLGSQLPPGGLCQGEGLWGTMGHQDGWVNERGEGCHQVPLGLAGRGLGYQRGWEEPAIGAGD